MKYPHIQQHDEKDCGAACFSMIIEYFGLKVSIAKLRELIQTDNMGTNLYGLIDGAQNLGLNAEALSGDFDDLYNSISNQEIQLPFVARIVNQFGYEHYIVVWNINDKYVRIGDPALNRTVKMPIEIFKKQWQGEIVTYKKTVDFKTGNLRKHSFSKFFKYILTQKKMLTFVFITSIIMSLINIAGSLVFEYVTQDVQLQTISVIMEKEEHEGHIHYEEDVSDVGIEEEHHHEDNEEYDYMSDDTRGTKLSDTISGINGKLTNKFGSVFKTLGSVCIAVIMLYALKMILEIFRGYLLSITAKLVDLPLTMSYYDHLLDLPTRFYGKRKAGEYMSRFNDTNNIKEAISSATLTIMLDSIMAIAGGILLCWINIKLFIITLIIMIIYSIVMLTFRNPLKNINHDAMEQGGVVTSYLKETIDGIETIKAYNYMSYAKDKTKKLYEKLLDFSVMGSFISTIQGALVTAVASIGVVILLWYGSKLCIVGVLSLSDLFIFYYMLGYFLSPVQNLVELQPQIQTAMVAAERLNDILEIEAENNNKTMVEHLKGDIIMKNIDFRYGNRELILNNLSMIFKSGTKTAIVGESGSGKTTISKLIMAFYKQEKGTLTINNVPIENYSPYSLRNKIAYISQNTFLFADTIYNNLRMGNEDITDEMIESMCKKCMADEFICKLPLGYNTKIEENGNNLSGGQKQRLAIVRALLRNPDILIMDEATSNIDNISERRIKQTIDNITSEITCIIIAHRLKTIKNCDKIYVLKNGEVIEQGTHEELLLLNGEYAKNWE